MCASGVFVCSSFSSMRVLMQCAARQPQVAARSHTPEYIHLPPCRAKVYIRSYAWRAEEFFLLPAAAYFSPLHRPSSSEGESSERATAAQRSLAHTVCCVFYRALIAPRGSVRRNSQSLVALERPFRSLLAAAGAHWDTPRDTLFSRGSFGRRVFRASTSWCVSCACRRRVRCDLE